MQIGNARSTPGSDRAVEHRLAGAHPVLVALHGVDLAVVGDVAVRVGERPRRERVRREAAVHEQQRALDALVEEITRAGTVGTAVTNQYLYKNISYDSEWSFTPIALVAELPNVVVVHPTFPASTLEEFVEYCKRQGSDQVSYGSSGTGATGHLTMEYLQAQAGIKLRHVPYGSRSRMIKDLLVGKILVAMDNLPPYLRHAQSGALRALGVSSGKRWFAAPDVPSIAERGYPDFEASLWWYIAAPAGTRLELVKKLSDEIVKGIESETAIRKIRESGASERPGNIDDLARHIAAERISGRR